MCGRKPKRLALRGTEVLPCWEAAPSPEAPGPARESAGIRARRRDERAPRTFVPVEELHAGDGEEAPAPAPRPVVGAAVRERWSLWGEPDA